MEEDKTLFKMSLLYVYNTIMDVMNALPELIFKMRHMLRKYGAIQFLPPVHWGSPPLPVTGSTRVKTQDQYLLIDPFAKKSVLSVVRGHQATSESMDHVDLQDVNETIPERAVILRTRTTTV